MAAKAMPESVRSTHVHVVVLASELPASAEDPHHDRHGPGGLRDVQVHVQVMPLRRGEAHVAMNGLAWMRRSIGRAGCDQQRCAQKDPARKAAERDGWRWRGGHQMKDRFTLSSRPSLPRGALPFLSVLVGLRFFSGMPVVLRHWLERSEALLLHRSVIEREIEELIVHAHGARIDGVGPVEEKRREHSARMPRLAFVGQTLTGKENDLYVRRRLGGVFPGRDGVAAGAHVGDQPVTGGWSERLHHVAREEAAFAGDHGSRSCVGESEVRRGIRI